MFKEQTNNNNNNNNSIVQCFIKCKNNIGLWVERNRYCIESIINIIIIRKIRKIRKEEIHSTCMDSFISLEILQNVPLTRAIQSCCVFNFFLYCRCFINVETCKLSYREITSTTTTTASTCTCIPFFSSTSPFRHLNKYYFFSISYLLLFICDKNQCCSFFDVI